MYPVTEGVVLTSLGFIARTNVVPMNPPVLCAMKETYIMKQWNPSYGYAQSIACWFNSSKAHTTRSVAESCNALQIRGRLICKTFLSSKEPHKCTWLLSTYFYGTNWATKTSTRSMELAKTSTSISFRSRSSESLQFLEANAHSAKRLSEKLKVYRNHTQSAKKRSNSLRFIGTTHKVQRREAIA